MKCKVSVLIFFIACYVICLVHCKPQLCSPPPSWTVDNGRNPMKELTGSVTLVALLNASSWFEIRQAQQMESMLEFLKGTGFDEFEFLIIAPHDLSESRMISDIASKVSFPVYRDSANESVWGKLDGGKHDIFIYDR